MNMTTRTLLSLALLALLTACGNKGPLVRPSQVPPQPMPGEAMPVPDELTPVDPAPPADDGNS